MINSVLKELSVFKSLSDKEILELLNCSSNKVSKYKVKDFIAFQGDICRSLYILYKGKVSAQMENSDGKSLTIEVLTAPNILAPAFIFATENRFPVNILALEDCEILIINKTDFLNFMHNNISVMQTFIQDISDRSMFLSKKINEFALQSLRSRIINYVKRIGYIKNQQAVALRLGVARPSLIKVITDLIDEGILQKSEDGITLKK